MVCALTYNSIMNIIKNTFSMYKNAKSLTRTRHTPSITHSFRCIPSSRPMHAGIGSSTSRDRD
uniref:Uncharacterized protein n=1 Tax=Anguilla anguilla TaxID=7936 RepID=A0A0E9WJ95_ANGAN